MVRGRAQAGVKERASSGAGNRSDFRESAAASFETHRERTVNDGPIRTPGDRNVGQRKFWLLGMLVVLGVVAVSLATLRVVAQDEAPLIKFKYTLARIRYATPNFNWWAFGGQGPPWS